MVSRWVFVMCTLNAGGAVFTLCFAATFVLAAREAGAAASLVAALVASAVIAACVMALVGSILAFGLIDTSTPRPWRALVVTLIAGAALIACTQAASARLLTHSPWPRVLDRLAIAFAAAVPALSVFALLSAARIARSRSSRST